jgi:hypothetical protein
MATPPPIAATTHGSQRLWCEFSVLKGCNAEFALDDDFVWIAHHALHQQDKFPMQLVCWFCDHVPFQATRPHDSYANFEERMLHIRGHIVDDYATVEHQRPDFHMIGHLYRLGLLDKETYARVQEYTELPDAYRLTYPQPSEEPLDPSDDWVTYDDRKERRQERRQERRRNHHEASRDPRQRQPAQRQPNRNLIWY